MLETIFAVLMIAGLIRYIWVSVHREPVEDFDRDHDPVAAIDSIREALHVEVRSTDFGALDEANEEVSRRPRLRAGTYPLPTVTNLKGTSTS